MIKGKDLKVDLKVNYERESMRPSKFGVRDQIEGKSPVFQPFTN